MIFQSKWRNAAYIVRPTVRIIHPGYGVDLKPGLRAVFKGPNRLFDTEQAQREHRWSDEEREQVEKHLLKHPDYGNGLYLAPGQDLPTEYATVARVDKTRTRCSHVELSGGDIVQCEEVSMVGSNKCATHREDAIRISKGMVTSEEAASSVT